jgi:hypothetical protein
MHTDLVIMIFTISKALSLTMLILLAGSIGHAAVIGVDANGTTTGVGVLDTSSRTWRTWGSTINVNGQNISVAATPLSPGSLNAVHIFGNYLFTSTGATITYSGLFLHQTYTFVFYSQQQLFGQNGTLGRGATFSVVSGSGTSSATSNGDAPVGSGFIENQNYVRFNNLTPDNTGSIAVTMTPDEGGVFLNAYEIETVPEASTTVFALLSCVALFRRKR